MSNHKSFTLIELLVVIAIIGVLSAIVITSISGAVTKSRIVRLQVFSDTIRAQLSDSLVSYWSFNEGTGVTAYDQWEGNNGTLGGGTPDYYPTWKSGGDCVSGKCLEFDGVNDYISIQGPILGTSSLSIETWFKINEQLDSRYLISVRQVGGSYDYACYLYVKSTLELCFASGVSGDVASVKSEPLTLNTWYHEVSIRNVSEGNTIISLYLNGVFIDSDTYDGIVNLPAFLAIGRHGATSYYFPGLIDEVHIYNSAATITQIQSQYLVGLDKLLSNGAISKSEYNQRIKELSKSLVIE